MLEIKSTSNGVRIEGLSSEVDLEVSSYFRRYHPAGYGTRIESTETRENDVKIVYISRYSSSD